MLRVTIIWLLSFLFLTLNLCAQQARIDSLSKQLPLLEGEEKVDALNDLVRGLMYTYPDEALDLSNQAIQVSEEIDFEEGRIMALISQGVIFNQRSLFQEAKDVLNQAKLSSESIDFQYGLAYSNLGLVAISIRENNYDKAIDLSFAGIDAAKKINNIDLEVSNLINIATVKQILEDYEGAKTFLLEAKSLVENNPEVSKIRMGQINGNLGIISSINLDYGIALEYFQDALLTFESLDSKAQVANLLMNIGYAYAQLKDTSSANKYYDRAEQIWIDLNNQRSQAVIFKNRGELMIDDSNFRQAIVYLNRGLEKEAFLDTALLSEIYALLSKANESLFRYKEALGYHKRHIVLKDSISNKTIQRNNERLTKQFELQKMKSEQEIELQKYEIENLKISKSRQVIFILCMVALMVAVWAIWNRYKLKIKLDIKEKDRLLAQQEIKLRQYDHESEKEKLVVYAKGLLSRNESLEKNVVELEEKLEEDERSNSDIDDLIAKMHSAVNGDRDWAAFVLYFEAVFPQFFSLIEENKQVSLTTNEQRLLALLKINLSNKEVAALLNISSDSVIRAKYRLKQKLGFSDAKEMLVFLSKLA